MTPSVSRCWKETLTSWAMLLRTAGLQLPRLKRKMSEHCSYQWAWTAANSGGGQWQFSFWQSCCFGVSYWSPYRMAMANGANRLADSVKLYFLTRLSGGRVNHWITVWEQAMFFFFTVTAPQIDKVCLESSLYAESLCVKHNVPPLIKLVVVRVHFCTSHHRGNGFPWTAVFQSKPDSQTRQ